MFILGFGLRLSRNIELLAASVKATEVVGFDVGNRDTSVRRKYLLSLLKSKHVPLAPCKSRSLYGQ